MAKKFNLAEFVQAEKVSDSDQMEITMIPWDHIRGNLDNFYAVDDVEELANSIRMHGLLDPIVVTPEEDEGWYMLISGHRRHKAWGQLREEDPEKYARIPAVIRRFESKAMAELALIMANSSARKLTDAEISRQAERIERLLYDLKEEGYEFHGRMREQVAKACQVSSSKLARLKVIREKLAECWTTKWNRGWLAEDVAYKLAQLPTEIQEKIFTAEPKPTARGVEKVGELMVAGNDYKCEGLTGPGCLKCTHGDAFLRHDLDDPWSPCEGKTCCLKCDKATRDWNPCSRMCSKAKDKRSRDSAARKAREAAAAERKQTAMKTRLRESAIRLAKAADASGAPDDAKFHCRYSWVTVGELRAYADGTKDFGCEYCNWLTTEEGMDAASAAKALGCSADYVCGLTEELHPAGGASPAPAAGPEDGGDEVYMARSRVIAPEWMTGDPPGDGRYLCLVDMDLAGLPETLHEQMLDRREGVWLAYGRGIEDMFDVVAWWPLPRKWERWMAVPGRGNERAAEGAGPYEETEENDE